MVLGRSELGISIPGGERGLNALASVSTSKDCRVPGIEVPAIALYGGGLGHRERDVLSRPQKGQAWDPAIASEISFCYPCPIISWLKARAPGGEKSRPVFLAQSWDIFPGMWTQML